MEGDKGEKERERERCYQRKLVFMDFMEVLRERERERGVLVWYRMTI